MKKISWVLLSLFCLSSMVFILTNNSLTGNLVNEDKLILCKQDTDCSGFDKCCQFNNEDGGICAKADSCSTVSSVTKNEKNLKAVAESINDLAFFLPMNGVIMGILISTLICFVFTLGKK